MELWKDVFYLKNVFTKKEECIGQLNVSFYNIFLKEGTSAVTQINAWFLCQCFRFWKKLWCGDLTLTEKHASWFYVQMLQMCSCEWVQAFSEKAPALMLRSIFFMLTPLEFFSIFVHWTPWKSMFFFPQILNSNHFYCTSLQFPLISSTRWGGGGIFSGKAKYEVFKDVSRDI